MVKIMKKVGCEAGRILIGKIDEETKTRFFTKIIRPLDSNKCWIWGAGKYPYGLFSYKGKSHMAHRISYWIHNGDVTEKMCVCHHCDNPACVNPKHLFLGRQIDNARDMKNKGRQAKGKTHGFAIHPEAPRRGANHPFRLNPDIHAKGEKVNTAVLTKRKVYKIRKLKSKGYSLNRLADMFNVYKSTIARIWHRKTWRHL